MTNDIRNMIDNIASAASASGVTSIKDADGRHIMRIHKKDGVYHMDMQKGAAIQVWLPNGNIALSMYYVEGKHQKKVKKQYCTDDELIAILATAH